MDRISSKVKVMLVLSSSSADQKSPQKLFPKVQTTIVLDNCFKKIISSHQLKTLISHNM